MLTDVLTSLMYEYEFDKNWPYDHNTTVLVTVQSNMAALLKSCIDVTNKFENLENLNILGLINGLSETLIWLQNNTEMSLKKESNGPE